MSGKWSSYCVISFSDLFLSRGWSEHWEWRAVCSKSQKVSHRRHKSAKTGNCHKSKQCNYEVNHVPSNATGQNAIIIRFYISLEFGTQSRRHNMSLFGDKIHLCISILESHIPMWIVPRRGGQWNKTSISAEVNNCLDFGAILLGHTMYFAGKV